MVTLDKYYTRLAPVDFLPKIRFADGICMAGSCFSEHIAEILSRHKYKVLNNPFGILYNPVALANSFERIARKHYYQEEDMVLHEHLFHSMDHHGSASGPDANLVVTNINDRINMAHEFLTGCRFVFVSLGTARVFRYRPTGNIAGNCHKIPQLQFDSFRLGTEDCIEALERIYHAVRSVNKEANIIWTVSPVRHVRDGLTENQLSKSTLLLAIEKMTMPSLGTSYFPAYEIMIDQLRDYRFYKEDLIHPSNEAIEVIWDFFGDTYLDHSDRVHHPAIERIQKGREHRFIHHNPTASKVFAESMLRQIQQVSDQCPDIDLKEERQYFFRLIEPD